MYLSIDDFNKIRPLQWTIRNYNDISYHTVATETDTQLFWADFLRTIFAPRYAQQNAILYIDKFDQTQPVLLTDSMDLLLPNDIEVAMYYSINRHEVPFQLMINVTMRTVLIVTIVIYIICLICYYALKFTNKFKTRTTTTTSSK
jgi:hypothetical protein